MHIIIDGYNLIRQSRHLAELDRRDLEAGRQALIDLLAAYKRIRPHRLTVVFDGGRAPEFSSRRQRLKGVQILFSEPGETADDLIRQLACEEREKALVVSSDREVVAGAEAAFSATMDSQAFEARLRMAGAMGGDFSDGEDESAGWWPSTRKKGPSRRLSRRERRNRLKIRKL